MAKKKMFSNKTYRKVVAKVDRWLTWEHKHVFNDATVFHVYNNDGTCVHVFVYKASECGMYLSIVKKRDTDEVARISGHAKKMSDINLFIKQVKLIG